jgi:hypothetical protein
MSRMKDWFPSIEKVEDKRPIREALTADVQAFLDAGGTIQPAVSVTLRCVQSGDSNARTRVVWAAEVASQSEVELHRPFNHRAPKTYGRTYLKDKMVDRMIRAGRKPGKVGA